MEYPQESFVATTFTPGSFWARRREVVRSQTLRHQLKMLKDTGRYDAFKLKWHPTYSDPPTVWPVPNHQFWDSDVAKWIEGACYLLMDSYDAEIDAAVKELVQMIRGAQQPDGYLNIHYTVVEPGKRFTNLRDMHELYVTIHTLPPHPISAKGLYDLGTMQVISSKLLCHITSTTRMMSSYLQFSNMSTSSWPLLEDKKASFLGTLVIQRLSLRCFACTKSQEIQSI